MRMICWLKLWYSHSLIPSKMSKAHDPHIQGQEHAQRYYHIRDAIDKKWYGDVRIWFGRICLWCCLTIDITWCGYNKIDGLIHRQVKKNRNCEQAGGKVSRYYQGNDLVLNFGLIGRYCNSFCLYYQGYYGLYDEHSLFNARICSLS